MFVFACEVNTRVRDVADWQISQWAGLISPVTPAVLVKPLALPAAALTG